MRNMSPQAYRRLRAAMTGQELSALAQDIALAIQDVQPTDVRNKVYHLLAHASPYTMLTTGARVRVLDSDAGTLNELRGKIESSVGPGEWLVRSPSGELAGPYEDSELERVEATS